MWVKREVFERQPLCELSPVFFEKGLAVGDQRVAVPASVESWKENRTFHGLSYVLGSLIYSLTYVTTFHLNTAIIPRSRHYPYFTKKETAGNPWAKETHSVRIKNHDCSTPAN